MTENAPQTLTVAQQEERLNQGWEWLKRYPNRRDWDARLEMWLRWLREYEQRVTAIERGAVPHAQEALL